MTDLFLENVVHASINISNSSICFKRRKRNIKIEFCRLVALMNCITCFSFVDSYTRTGVYMYIPICLLPTAVLDHFAGWTYSLMVNQARSLYIGEKNKKEQL